MAKPEKVNAVEELKERIQGNTAFVMTKWIGLNAGQATDLRQRLRENDVQFKIYKNTLAKIALNELGLDSAIPYIDGPTGWAFSSDPVLPAKTLKEFSKTHPQVQMNGGILDGQAIDASKLETLATLPSRDVLLGQVAGTVAAPLQNLLGVLNAVPRNLVTALDQVRQQKEDAEAA